MCKQAPSRRWNKKDIKSEYKKKRAKRRANPLFGENIAQKRQNSPKFFRGIHKNLSSGVCSPHKPHAQLWHLQKKKKRILWRFQWRSWAILGWFLTSVLQLTDFRAICNAISYFLYSLWQLRTCTGIIMVINVEAQSGHGRC